eukprot:3679497-Rhodomonas_salina.2
MTALMAMCALRAVSSPFCIFGTSEAAIAHSTVIPGRHALALSPRTQRSNGSAVQHLASIHDLEARLKEAVTCAREKVGPREELSDTEVGVERALDGEGHAGREQKRGAGLRGRKRVRRT